MTTRDYVFRLRGDNAQLVQAHETAAQAATRHASATQSVTAAQATAQRTGDGYAASMARQTQQLGRVQAGAAALGQAGKLSAQQIQQVSFQLNDLAVQVASGGNPLIALVQQGSQLSGTFGGIRPALAAVGSLITPAVVGFGGLAAAVGATALAFVQGTREQAKFENSLALTGNRAGVTRGQVDAMADSISRSTGTTVGSTKELLGALVATGQIGAQNFGVVAQAGQQMADKLGMSVDDVAKLMVRLAKEPTQVALELNKTQNFLSLSQAEQIRSLEQQGRVAEAAGIALGALTEHYKRQQPELGAVQLQTRALTQELSSLWQMLLNVGKAPTPDQKVRQTLAAIEARNRAGGAQDGVLEEQLRRESLEALRERENATAEALRTEGRQAGIAASQVVEATLRKADAQRRLNGAMEDGRRQVAALNAQRESEGNARLSAAEEKKFFDQIRNDNSPSGGGGRSAAQISEFERERMALRERLAMVGLNTEADKLQAEIALGKYAKLSVAQRGELVALARELDAKNAKRALEEDLQRYAERSAQFTARAEVQAQAEVQRIVDGNQALRQEIELLGATEEGKAAVEKARLGSAIALKEEQLAMRANAGESEVQLATLRQEIALLRERADLIGRRQVVQAGYAVRDEAERQAKEAGDANYESVRDALSRAFQDTKNPAKAFAEGLGNAIYTRMTARMADALATDLVGKDGQSGLFGQLLTRLVDGTAFGGGLQIDTSGAGTVDATRNAASDSLRAFEASARDSTAATVTATAKTVAEAAATSAATGSLVALTQAANVAAGALATMGASGGASGLGGFFGGAFGNVDLGGDFALPGFGEGLDFSVPGFGGGLFAKGGAFDRGGQVTAFARGGIVDRPTEFSYGGGRRGLMGEAGPESVMPLGRTRDGKLGVHSLGGGAGGDLQVTVNVIGGGPAPEVSTRRNGNRLDIDLLYRQVVNRLTADTQQGGGLDPIMSGRYGLNPGANGRL
jgi:phage-related minor tail protein